MGEFDSIQLKGKLKVQRNSLALVHQGEEKKDIKHKNLQANQNEKSYSKNIPKTSSMNMKLICFVVFVPIAIWFFWLRKRS